MTAFNQLETMEKVVEELFGATPVGPNSINRQVPPTRNIHAAKCVASQNSGLLWGMAREPALPPTDLRLPRPCRIAPLQEGLRLPISFIDHSNS